MVSKLADLSREFDPRLTELRDRTLIKWPARPAGRVLSEQMATVGGDETTASGSQDYRPGDVFALRVTHLVIGD